MKKTITAVFIAASLAGCGTAAVQQPKVLDEGTIKTYELQQQSNTQRIERLEKELSETKTAMESMQRQSKQLGESYDGLLSLFNEQKKVMIGLMTTLNKVFTSDDKKEDKK